MSWGYFAELRLAVDRSDWANLLTQRIGDVALAPGWSGLRDRQLEASFGHPGRENPTFEEALAWPCFQPPHAARSIDDDGARITVRVCAQLDKSLLDQAHPLATLFYAARESGAEGTFRLVNDGTYSGEDGSELKLAAGKIKKQKLANWSTLVEAMVCELLTHATPKGNSVINPFTGKPIATGAPARGPAPAKPARRKPPGTRAAPRKPASSKPARRKG